MSDFFSKFSKKKRRTLHCAPVVRSICPANCCPFLRTTEFSFAAAAVPLFLLLSHELCTNSTLLLKKMMMMMSLDKVTAAFLLDSQLGELLSFYIFSIILLSPPTVPTAEPNWASSFLQMSLISSNCVGAEESECARVASGRWLMSHRVALLQSVYFKVNVTRVWMFITSSLARHCWIREWTGKGCHLWDHCATTGNGIGGSRCPLSRTQYCQLLSISMLSCCCSMEWCAVLGHLDQQWPLTRVATDQQRNTHTRLYFCVCCCYVSAVVGSV